jgi:hypothetical protein
MAFGGQRADDRKPGFEIRQKDIDERYIQPVSCVERVMGGCGDTDYAQAFGRREQLAEGRADPTVVLHDEHPTAFGWSC